MGFNPTFNEIGGVRFDSAFFEVKSTTAGRFVPIRILEHGVNTVLIQAGFDPGFDADVGANGAVLLARLDFDIV